MFDGIATKVSQLDKVKKSVEGLNKSQALLAITASNLIEADKKYYIEKLKLIPAEEADTVATTANTKAKAANLSITNLLKVAWAKLTSVIKANPYVAATAGLIALGVAMGKVADRVYNAEKYAKKALDKSAEKVDEVRSEIDSLNSELETTKSRIDELNAKENLSLAEQEELNRLKETNAELEREIRLKQSILSEEEKEANKDTKKYFTTAKDSLTFESSYEGVEIHDKTDYIGTVEERIDRLQQYTEGKIKLSEDTIESYKNYVESAISDFMDEDDYLIEGQDDDILERLDALYEKYDLYTNGKASVVENKLSSILAKVDFQDSAKQLEELGKNGELSITTLTSRFPALIEYLEQAGISAEELYQYIMALSNPDAINYNNVRQQLMDSLGFGNGIDSASEAKTWTEIFNLGEEELVLDAYLKIRDQYGEHPEGWNAMDWLSHIQEELEAEKGTTLSIPKTIDQLNTQLKPSFDSLNSVYQDIFADDDFALNSIDILSTCDSIKSKLDEMAELGLSIDYSSYEDFVKVLSDSESEADDVKKAFNALATSITQAGLSGAEDFETMKAALEDLGIINNEMVAFDALTSNTDALKEAGLDLATATEEQIKAFVDEMVSTENCEQAFALLQLRQAMMSENPLETIDSVRNILALAQAAGISGEALEQLAGLMASYDEAMAQGNYTGATVIANEINKMKAKIDSEISNFKPTVDWDGTTDSASKSGKAAADTYLDAFEKELSHLDTLKDHGKIAEKEYLDSLRALYERYFKDKKQYTEEYAKYERQYLEGMKSLYDSALSGLSKLMDSKIDGYEHAKDTAIEGLEAEKEAAESAYQAQIDAIQEQIDAIDDLIDKKEKQIDAINEEIDKIKEASEARKRSLDLQKAEYELERMQNQRTQLIFDGEQLVYRPDESGIRDARENLTEIQEDMQVAELEKKISLIEKEIDLLEEQKAGLGKQQDAIREMLDSSNKYYEDLIKQTENYYDTMIKNLESQKARYQELAGLQETAEAYSAVEQVFGSLGYSLEDVLNGSDAAFEDFKAKYIDLISSINNNPVFAEGLAYAADIATDSLGSFHDIAQETVAGINNLSSSASTLVNDTDGLAANLEQISSDLSNIPVSEGFSAWVEAFTNLGAAIKTVAGALGIGEDGTVGGLVEALESLNILSLGNENEADNEENTVVKKFLSLKSAIHDVIAAISGDQTGESKENDSISSSPSMSDGATGSGGLIGAINSLKTTADDVLGSEGGQKNSEKSTGVIGQFGVLKATVENTAHAIGSNQKNNKPDEENTGTLIDSITELGKKTEETLTGGKTGDKENSVIGRFEAFKNVIGEANEHITGISKGLEEIDGQNAECTIRVKIEASGNFSDQLENVPELTATGMNLESAEYRAVYKGNHLSPSPQIKSPLTSGRTLIPLSAAEPEKAQMYTAFQDYLMTAGSKNTALERQTAGLIKPASQTLTANINTKQQNPPPIQIGDISFTCTGVTGEQVMQQIENQFQGLFLNAYQKSMIRN